MENEATRDCDGEYLKVEMTIVDEGTIHDHISLMLANPSARVEFEERLGSEIHLLLNNVRADQVYVDSIDFGVLIDGETGQSKLLIEEVRKILLLWWRVSRE